jgi:hypothetical protein
LACPEPVEGLKDSLNAVNSSTSAARAARRQRNVLRFWCESSARLGKNLCDTLVANFLFDDPRVLPRAFPTKARSHFTIAAPLGLLGLLLWNCRKPGMCSIMVAGFHDIFYTCTKQTKIPAN